MKQEEILEQYNELRELITATMDVYMSKPVSKSLTTKLTYELDAIFTMYNIRMSFEVGLFKDSSEIVISATDLRTYLMFNTLFKEMEGRK